MRTKTSFILIIIFIMATGAVFAQSPREELQQMVEQLQKAPNDHALREKIIKLATSIKPAPAIPEEAREPFVMGATVLKKANDPAGAGKAVDLFTQALNIAPWFADAYYNRAIAREAAGQFEPAIDDLKLYLEFKLTDAERREAQDKIYELKASAQLASAKKAEQDKIAGAEETKRQAQQAKRDVITQIKNAVANRNYNNSTLSYSDDSRRMWEGVNQYELFGGGKYWLYGNYDYYIYFWKFFDERVEVWGTDSRGGQHLKHVGESWGPKVTDMRWFMAKGDNTKSETQQVWGYLDLQNGYLYTSFYNNPRPLNDSEFDPNKRYSYERFAPPE